MEAKSKVAICKLVKDIYNKEVIPFDGSATSFRTMSTAYAKIATLFDSFKATHEDVLVYLGIDLYTWYFEEYDEISNIFLVDK